MFDTTILANTDGPPPQSQPRLHPRELRAKNGGGAVRDRDCEFMMYGSGSVEALFSPEWTKNKLQ